MTNWKVTWWDGSSLRETFVGGCDAYNVVNMATSLGVQCWAILKIERVPS